MDVPTALQPATDPHSARVALTVAILASFTAFSAIKSGNVAQAMQQAQAERNNSWSWYQAARLREAITTNELANLERLKRNSGSTEIARLQLEIVKQNADMDRVRARVTAIRARAEGAEKAYGRYNLLGDHYDLSDALLAISITLLAISTLTGVRWLYWFSMGPAVAGVVFALAAMLQHPFNLTMLFAWLG